MDLRAGRVHLEGEPDRTCAHHLVDALAALVLTPHTVWRVDAARVAFCDVAGLRALALAAAPASGSGRTVQVEHGSGFLAQLLDLAGLAHLVGPADLRPRVVAAGRHGAALRCGSPS